MGYRARAELATMTDSELRAYWNILQFRLLTNGRVPLNDDGKTISHLPIVDSLLTERGIPHQHGKLINTIPGEQI